MEETVELASPLTRLHCRGLLLDALEKEVIIVALTLGKDNKVILKTKNWEDFWRPAPQNLPEGVRCLIGNLWNAWSKYIRSAFDKSLRREYCCRYFNLLEHILSAVRQQPGVEFYQELLYSTLSFENFGIEVEGAHGEFYAAATCALRNPCYLLAKLRAPKLMAEDGQLLPMIALATPEKSTELFFQYHQHRLGSDSGTILFLYICASKQKRSSSYMTINALEHLISKGVDPRAHGHAVRIANRVIVPYLNTYIDSGHCQKIRDGFEILDVGAGKGILSATVCQELQKYFKSKGMALEIQVRMVDLAISNPARFFLGRRLSNSIDSITFTGGDYRKLFSQETSFGEIRGLRIGILARTLDSLRDCKIIPCGRNDLEDLGIPRETQSFLAEELMVPSEGLGDVHKGSLKTLPYKSGKIHNQLYLSEFYKGIYALLNGKETLNEQSSGTFFLPFRCLSSVSLFCDGGGSLIEKLAQNSTALIIVDEDLSPEELNHHMAALDSSLIALNLTKSIGLTSYNCYLMLNKFDPAAEMMGGKLVWPN